MFFWKERMPNPDCTSSLHSWRHCHFNNYSQKIRLSNQRPLFVALPIGFQGSVLYHLYVKALSNRPEFWPHFFVDWARVWDSGRCPALDPQPPSCHRGLSPARQESTILIQQTAKKPIKVVFIKPFLGSKAEELIKMSSSLRFYRSCWCCKAKASSGFFTLQCKEANKCRH